MRNFAFFVTLTAFVVYSAGASATECRGWQRASWPITSKTFEMQQSGNHITYVVKYKAEAEQELCESGNATFFSGNLSCSARIRNGELVRDLSRKEGAHEKTLPEKTWPIAVPSHEDSKTDCNWFRDHFLAPLDFHVLGQNAQAHAIVARDLPSLESMHHLPK